MHKNFNPTPKIPESPLRIFVREPCPTEGPFYVTTTKLASEEEMRDITDEEVSALAHIIYNAYLEWKKQ